MTGVKSFIGCWIRRYKGDTKMILKKCADCKNPLFCTAKMPKNQGKTVYETGEKCFMKVQVTIF